MVNDYAPSTDTKCVAKQGPFRSSVTTGADADYRAAASVDELRRFLLNQYHGRPGNHHERSHAPLCELTSDFYSRSSGDVLPLPPF